MKRFSNNRLHLHALSNGCWWIYYLHANKKDSFFIYKHTYNLQIKQNECKDMCTYTMCVSGFVNVQHLENEPSFFFLTFSAALMIRDVMSFLFYYLLQTAATLSYCNYISADFGFFFILLHCRLL